MHFLRVKVPDILYYVPKVPLDPKQEEQYLLTAVFVQQDMFVPSIQQSH